MKSIVIFILFAAVIATCRSEEVTGEIFIVTDGSENVRLGRVEVSAYGFEDTENYIAKKRSVATAILSRIIPIDVAAKKAYDDASADMIYIAGHAPIEIDAAHEKFNSTFGVWKQVLQARHYLESAAFYFRDLGEPIASAKTDSSGRYTLNLKPGKYALSAEGRRTVGGSIEWYHWLVQCEVFGGKKSEASLSNDNLTIAASAESLLRTGSPKNEIDPSEGEQLIASFVPRAPEVHVQVGKMSVAEAQRHALEIYPSLGVLNSPLNAKYVNRVKIYRQEKPDFFDDSEWPWKLAVEIAGPK